ncbi:MAG: hypothetical protein Athens101428_299 [Candidatus Berkelbacteria bacterium Athens1014_28]|uniref:Histidine kinase N-terminal 7TM region domain-containing protein n=1 Tax=Candidatus Berkelbacteria bacterium Athens1014_28 TaxID=2017145 RepID=A0A554LN77_9BACT|nr:MAG: hypothetical protein Athens101428_299 [Candidatus Berkelbacteria bacterium Athens1014_28]
MSYWVVALAAVGIGYIAFGFYVLVKKKADAISRVFMFFALSVAAWNLSLMALVGRLVQSKTAIIVFDRIAYAAAPFIIMSIVFYLVKLRGLSIWQEIKKNKFLLFLIVLAMVNLILVPTNLISNNQGDSHMVVGSLMPLFGFFVLVALIYAVYLCYDGWKTGHEDSRRKFWFVLLGLILTSVCSLIFDVVLPILGYQSLPMVGALSTIFVVWFLGLGAVGVYIAGGALGIISSILIAIILSSILIGIAVFIMFILLAGILGSV